MVTLTGGMRAKLRDEQQWDVARLAKEIGEKVGCALAKTRFCESHIETMSFCV